MPKKVLIIKLKMGKTNFKGYKISKMPKRMTNKLNNNNNNTKRIKIKFIKTRNNNNNSSNSKMMETYNYKIYILTIRYFRIMIKLYKVKNNIINLILWNYLLIKGKMMTYNKIKIKTKTKMQDKCNNLLICKKKKKKNKNKKFKMINKTIIKIIIILMLLNKYNMIHKINHKREQMSTNKEENSKIKTNCKQIKNM